MTHELVLLADIELDLSLRVRPVRPEIADEYREDLDALPPVLLGRLGPLLLLLDGWHRYQAHLDAGAREIKAVVRDLRNHDEARLIVAGCDAHVGLRRTREAKRLAVEMMLANEETAGWSDRMIAKHTGTSHPFVASVLASFGKAGGAGCQDEGGNVSTPAGGDGGDATEGGLVPSSEAVAGDEAATPDAPSPPISTASAVLDAPIASGPSLAPARGDAGSPVATRPDCVTSHVLEDSPAAAPLEGDVVPEGVPQDDAHEVDPGAVSPATVQADGGSAVVVVAVPDRGSPIESDSDANLADDLVAFIGGPVSVSSILSDIERLLDATKDVDDRRSYLADLASWVEGAMAELEVGEDGDGHDDFEELDEVG